MGLIDRLRSQKLFIDTAPLIYFIEGQSPHNDKLLELFRANDTGEIAFQTSTLTLLEVLVLPLKEKKLKLAKQYEQILTHSPHLDIYDVDSAIAKRAANLRARNNLKTADAIQMATTIEKRADFFFTNDKALQKVKDIKVLLLEDL